MNSAALNGFDRLAFCYDALARIVFGKQIVAAQRCFLDTIPDGSNVLILGGGTGWLLAEVCRRKPDCKVWYIEASQRMIALSKEKIMSDANIYFIHGTEQSIPPRIQVDVVITNFYLDLFSDGSLKKILPRIMGVTTGGTCWLATDFVYEGKWWQSVLLKIMYRFFRITGGIEARRLPQWQLSLQHAGLVSYQEKTFFGGFIKSVVYRR